MVSAALAGGSQAGLPKLRPGRRAWAIVIDIIDAIAVGVGFTGGGELINAIDRLFENEIGMQLRITTKDMSVEA